MGYAKHYNKNVDIDLIEEIIFQRDPLCFTYKKKDYYLEYFNELGWIIVEPKSYWEAGGYPDKAPVVYPMSGKAKLIDELLVLPFLDGKTMFERFNELKFFDASYTVDEEVE